MKQYCIIVAGGSGKRMNSSIPKQFLLLKNRPVLMHTISKFYEFNNKISLIVVLPQKQIEYWQQLVEKFDFKCPHKIIKGGETRFDSVKNGLKAVTEPGIVAIHDGVRPLVSHETIQRCFNVAKSKGNAIPCLAVVDSIREIFEFGSVAIDRKTLRTIQTPQVFTSEILIKAYQRNYAPEFTDDACVVERSDEKINLVEGNRENIKITTQFDLDLANLLI